MRKMKQAEGPRTAPSDTAFAHSVRIISSFNR